MAKQMIYESKWGEETVELTMSQYADNGNIFLELINTQGEYPEPYGNVTVNLVDVPKYCGYVDTNNMPEMEKFIKDNDLGELQGLHLEAAFVNIPFMFLMWIN